MRYVNFLFFLTVFMVTSAFGSSAGNDPINSPFSHHFYGECLQGRRTYKYEEEGAGTRTVNVSYNFELREAKITLEHQEGEKEPQERNKNLCITMDFSLQRLTLQEILIRSDGVLATIRSYIAVSPDDYGHVEIPLHPIWTFSVPKYGVVRPAHRGTINCALDKMDVTQYLFFGCNKYGGRNDRLKYFMRMTVKYSDLEAVDLVWGQEFCKDGSDAQTVFGRKTVLMRDVKTDNPLLKNIGSQ